MSEMVERVARAQYARWRGNPMLSSAPDWDACDELDQASWLDNARAAIQAMRPATGTMVEKGADELWPYDATPTEYEGAVTQACDVWDAMIDAALSLSPPASAGQSGEGEGL